MRMRNEILVRERDTQWVAEALTDTNGKPT
jgi:hypothetical protein